MAWHLAIAITVGLLPLVPHVIDWLQVRLPLRTSPLVREALQRVTDDPRVVATLGQPGDEAAPGCADRDARRQRPCHSLCKGSRHNLEQITSANGSFIHFEHDPQSRVTSAVDKDAHRVRYTYDAGGRLAAVTGPESTLVYRYSDIDLVSIENASRPLLRVHKDDDRRVSQLDLADGRSFRFSYVKGDREPGEAVVEAPDAHGRM